MNTTLLNVFLNNDKQEVVDKLSIISKEFHINSQDKISLWKNTTDPNNIKYYVKNRDMINIKKLEKENTTKLFITACKYEQIDLVVKYINNGKVLGNDIFNSLCNYIGNWSLDSFKYFYERNKNKNLINKILKNSYFVDSFVTICVENDNIDNLKYYVEINNIGDNNIFYSTVFNNAIIYQKPEFIDFVKDKVEIIDFCYLTILLLYPDNNYSQEYIVYCFKEMIYIVEKSKKGKHVLLNFGLTVACEYNNSEAVDLFIDRGADYCENCSRDFQIHD